VTSTAGLDAATRELLDRYGFDERLFEHLRARVAAGELSESANAVRGRVEPPLEEDLATLPAPGEPAFAEAREAGLRALRRGEVAVAVLNGGMATRFGGVVKGVVGAVDGLSFLELKVRETQRVATAAGAEIPFAVMNSFATHEATQAFLRARGIDGALTFSQSVSLRLTREGELFRQADGSLSPYAPGHGDFGPALRASGVLDELHRRGTRLLMLSNVDNLGARPDPVVVGMHVLSGRRLTTEVAAKEPGDRGGAPARVGGRPLLLEGFRFPPDFDQSRIRVFGTNSFVVDLDALDAEYPLTWFYVEKTVGGRPAVQLERLVNELTSFLPTLFLEVPRTGPRGRFFPVKEPEDLEAAREPLREMLAAPVL
jgi:UTP--glucose-1-phosphate uridylyltransferase